MKSAAAGRAGALLGALALLLAFGGAPAYAAGISVTTTADELNSDSDCSLREAITAANTDAGVDACTAGSGADTITVPAGTYTLSIPGSGENANATGDLDITSDLIITGAGAATTTVDAAGLDRVVHLVAGTAVIQNVAITGGFVSTGDNSISFGDDGGGVLVGDGQTMTLSGVTVNGNSAGTNGGGVYAGGAATLTVQSSAITNNVVSGGGYPGGGGIGSGNTNFPTGGTVIVHQSVISGNTGTYGGGFHNGEGASLTITDSTISGNTMTGAGGGMWSGGNLSLERVTVSGNMGVSPGGYHSGAGIYDQSSSGDLVSIVNVTLSGNFAASGTAQGQNLYKTSSEPFDFDSSTIANGDIQANAGEVSFRNTIIDAACTSVFSPIFSSNGYNIESGSSCGLVDGVNGDHTNTNPMLGPLANNGGPTYTHALLSGSPAINAGSPSCPPPATDQRGVSRPSGLFCDIGAFELVQFHYNFTGFFAPVANLPVFNRVKAGSGIPVKFSLGGNQGLNIFATGYPKSQQITCDASATPLTSPVSTVGSLSYDAPSDRYLYAWKSDKGWAMTCRKLIVQLSDGGDHIAYFNFSK